MPLCRTLSVGNVFVFYPQCRVDNLMKYLFASFSEISICIFHIQLLNFGMFVVVVDKLYYIIEKINPNFDFQNIAKNIDLNYP